MAEITAVRSDQRLMPVKARMQIRKLRLIGIWVQAACADPRLKDI